MVFYPYPRALKPVTLAMEPDAHRPAAAGHNLFTSRLPESHSASLVSDRPDTRIGLMQVGSPAHADPTPSIHNRLRHHGRHTAATLQRPALPAATHPGGAAAAAAPHPDAAGGGFALARTPHKFGHMAGMPPTTNWPTQLRPHAYGTDALR